ncbi:hypothetical protein MYCTH_2311508 [Thermothelomyces thermophilus ATCC 42464]|uniref:ADP-ribose 1''-phosphate phosphatase n=1 Tax=Thermothelomyces thermophilus (strain ATCC 42464 / BCRC 31852 / DSM 1799) TaxID=573729 RepID=G2QP81_THET4|nr:uncharacterized protein MYCTH_2311508 [Thermothelomyces thermophilus ATCC 42464]AEO61394.1 hypothetical protein MYCTH_2311508 [Thermothelomyces thermophilus ATCC 42464]
MSVVERHQGSPTATEDRGSRAVPEGQQRGSDQTEQSITAKKPSMSPSEPTESGSSRTPIPKSAKSQVPPPPAAAAAAAAGTGATNITLAPDPSPPTARIRIADRIGDLFAAPPNSVLIHACNTVGSWGGGIALAFRSRYPDAFKVYRAHCARSIPDQLVGTALLIRPPAAATAGGATGGSRGMGHYIGCLFTSRGYGRSRDPPESILGATGPAMRHLMRLIAEEEERTGAQIGEVRMCRINSGLFAVPWDRTKRVVEELELAEGEVPGNAEGGVVEIVAWERE